MRYNLTMIIRSSRVPVACCVAALLAACAGHATTERASAGDRTSAHSHLASSDRLLLAASLKATGGDVTGEAGAVRRRARNDGEEVGASMNSTSWKINRDPNSGQGELCAVQNYYLAPKPVH